MKIVLRALGWLLLIFTIGLATCQTLLKAGPQISADIPSFIAEARFAER